MKLIFADEAWEDYLYWQTQDKRMVARIDPMARYKHIDAPKEVPLGDTSPRFIAVDLERQFLPGPSNTP